MSDTTSDRDRLLRIAPFSGGFLEVHPGQFLTVTDDEGGQLADFFAESAADSDEILSSGVTIDCNDCLALRVGHTLYSDWYRPMFDLVEDTVGEHDLIHPCCRPQLYDYFYGTGEGAR